MQNIIKLIIKGDVLSYLANYVKNTYYYLECSIMLDPKKTIKEFTAIILIQT